MRPQNLKSIYSSVPLSSEAKPLLRLRPLLALVLAWSLVFIPIFPAALLAAPEGVEVVQGDVGINTQGAFTSITASDGSIIRYTGFDIARDETVRFIQPSELARVLNHIPSARPTQIDGTLLANGQVYLVNPAGVFFNQGSRVDVARLVAAAGNLSYSDFSAGIDRFTELAGDVENRGVIDAEVAQLVGRHVRNLGSVRADDGLIIMVAGEDVLLGERDGRLFVKLEGAAATLDESSAGVSNEGTLEAPGGVVSLAAGDLYAMAIFHDGVTQADSIALAGGDGGTVEVAGTLDASNESAGSTGGRIEVTGERIAVDQATLDASGDAGGGEILVGGDFQGSNPDVRNASRTFVGSEAVLRADATGEGDGGRVIVWSDEVTGFAGTISARGAEEGGDGGFAEVSGKEALSYRGFTDLRAAEGARGTLLLDPKNIAISAAGTDAIAGNNQFAENAADNKDFLNTDVVAALDGANVVLQANNDITVSAAVDASGNTNAGNFTLQAGRAIAVNADVDVRGDFVATANSTAADGVVDANRDAGPATFSMSGGSEITTTDGGNIAITVSTGAGNTNTESGNISVDNLTAAGTVSLTNNGPTAGSEIEVVGANTVLTGTTVTLNNAAAGAAGTENLQIAGDAEINGAITNLASLDVTGASDLGANVTTTGNQNYGQAVTLGAATILTSTTGKANFASTLDGSQTLVVNGEATFEDVVGGTNPLTGLLVSGATEINGGAVTTTNAGPVGVQGYQGPVTLGADTTLTVDSGGPNSDVTFGSTLDGGHTLAVNTAGETIFAGDVGATTALVSVATDAGGATALRSNVTTTGTQNYGDALSVDAATTTLTGSTVSVAGATTGAGADENLVVAGDASFGDDVSALNSLTVAGNTAVAGNVTTTGAQTYGTPLSASGALTVDLATTTLTGTTVSVKQTTTGVDGDENLVVVGAADFQGGVSNLASTSFTGPATITGGGVTTTGTQSYGGTVTTGAQDTVLSATDIAFGGGAGSVSGTGELTLRPVAASDSIDIGVDTAGFDLDSADLAALADGFSGIVVGTETTGAHAITVGGISTFTDPLTLETPVAPGSVAIDAQLNALGGLTVNGSGATMTLSADVVTAGTPIAINDSVLVNANVELDTTNGGVVVAGSTIGITGTTDDNAAAGTNSLRLNAGTGGAATLGGNVGDTRPLGELTIDGQSTINSVATATGGGSGNQNYNGPVTVIGPVVGFFPTPVLSGTNLTFADTLTGSNGTQQLTVNASGTMRFNGAVDSLRSFQTGGSGTAELAGGSVTTSFKQTYNTPVSLFADTTLTSNAFFSSSISFADTVEATANQDLTVLVTLGSLQPVTFSGAVGGNARPLGTLTIGSAGDVTASSTIDAARVIQSIGTGTTTLNGAVTTSGLGAAGGLSFTGTDLAINAPLSTPGADVTIVFADGDVTTSAAGTINAERVVQSAGTGTTTLNGAVTTSGLGAAGGLSFTGTDLTINAPVSTPGADVTIGFATNVLTSAAGTINAERVVQSSGSLFGTTTLGGAVTTTGAGGAGGFSFSGGNLNLNASVSAPGADFTISTINATVSATSTITADNFVQTLGTGTTTIDGTVTLADDFTIVSAGNVEASAGSAITADRFVQSAGTGTTTLDGALTLSGLGAAGGLSFAGTDLVINGPVSALGSDVTIVSASDVTLATTGSTVSDGLVQTNGAGTTMLNGSVTTNSGTGVSLTGLDFVLNGNVTTTTGGGGFSVANAGGLDIQSGANLDLGGAFAQTGAGAVQLDGSIATADAAVGFASAVLATGSGTISAGAGDVTFSSTVDGPGSLGVGSQVPAAFDSGRIIFGADVGQVTPLANLVLDTTQTIEFATAGQPALVTADNVRLNTQIPLAQITAAAGFPIRSGSNIRLATIYRTPDTATGAARDLAIVATTDFEMGSAGLGGGQKLSVPGSLVITAGNDASLGDVSALDVMVTAGSAINAIKRVPGDLYLTDGTLVGAGTAGTDTGTDWVANAFNVNPNPTVIGTGPAPTVATPAGTVGFPGFNAAKIFEDGSSQTTLVVSDFAGNAAGGGPFPGGVFNSRPAVMDRVFSSLVSSGAVDSIFIPPEEITSMLAPSMCAAQGAQKTLPQCQPPPWPGEVIEFLECSLFDGENPDMVPVRCQQFAAENRGDGRFQTDEAVAAKSLYLQFYGEGDQLRASLREAADAYRGATPTGEFSGAGYRAYVDGNDEFASAQVCLAQLTSFYVLLDEIVGGAEVQDWQEALLDELTPAGLSPAELDEAIRSGPSDKGIPAARGLRSLQASLGFPAGGR